MGNSGDRRGGRVWARTVAFICRRDKQYGCYLNYEHCTGTPQTADHIVPYDPKDPSLDRYSNLAGACKACNQARGNRPLTQEQLEHLASRGLGPLATRRAREEEAEEVDRKLVDEPFRIIFDGAGKPSHRKLLDSMGVKAMMVSYWELTRVRRVPQKGFDDLMHKQFPEDVEIFLDSGWAKAMEKLAPGELEAYAAEYTGFVRKYADRLSGAVEPHLDALGADWIHRWRKAQGADMGTLFWPVWRPREGMPALASLAKEYDNVALPQEALEKDPVVPPRLGALHRQHQTSFHALGCANPDTLRGVALATTSTQSWASPQMRGETIVWDGARLVRYRADRKDQARARYKGVADQAGLDYQAILDDDASEVTRLAIWSYQQLEKSMQGTRSAAHRALVVTGSPKPEGGMTVQGDQSGVEDSPDGVLNSESDQGRASLVPRPENERMTLPVFGVQMKDVKEVQDGAQVDVPRPFISSQGTSMRQCNTCVISGNCPAFQEDASCKFDFPVEIRTKDQLKSLLSSVVEMQAGRVAFAKFAEDMNGGYPDPNLSQEVDRLFNLVKKMGDMDNNSEFIKVNIERQTSGGVLSNLFGERAVQAATQVQQLPSGPVKADDILEATVIEGA